MKQEQFSIYDVAEWFWSFRWLIIGLLALAGIWTAVLVVTTPSQPVAEPTSEVQLRVKVLASGTPLRSAEQISDIVSSALDGDEVKMTSISPTTTMLFTARTMADAEAIMDKLQQIDTALETEVRQRVQLLANEESRVLQSTEFAASQYLGAVTFVGGIDAGLIKIVDAYLEKQPGSAANAVPVRVFLSRLILPWAFAGAVFVVVTGVMTFARGWKRHRSGRL
ncbi:hypothetical protein DevBK_20795 [Devosia sp. BK]|uniref:hypothetical protein n=1 Tax=Devosia sp. BK TaxID=2871706 RepID=UPI002939EE81|nr:hypothetical protein [Devosia sp. BK]MDV3253786.1 hypothetical protein [Devosia sp. BK]